MFATHISSSVYGIHNIFMYTIILLMPCLQDNLYTSCISPTYYLLLITYYLLLITYYLLLITGPQSPKSQQLCQSVVFPDCATHIPLLFAGDNIQSQSHLTLGVEHHTFLQISLALHDKNGDD